jgi:predicted MPP superfamily phosphohydrolase
MAARNPDVVASTIQRGSRAMFKLRWHQMRKVLAPRVCEHDIAISGLGPRHDGVRIAQLSDLHVGIDDPVTRHHDLDLAFAGVDRNATCVALCHTPSLGQRVAERGADLVLSGHTHGGQIFVPGITDRIMRTIGLHYRSGRYEMPSLSTLYVTPGIGFSGVTRRSGDGTDAEVAVFTLRAA